MIFQHTWRWILEPSPHTGKLKTQTRRLVKAGQKDVYCVGKTYAVQPGRGKPGLYWRYSDVAGNPPFNHEYWSDGFDQDMSHYGWHPLRIRILSIRREDVRKISWDDVRAEGFHSRYTFFETWINMHDPELAKTDWGEEILRQQPAHLYDAWVLEFEVAR